MSFDRDGRIRYFNRGAERLSGFSAGKMLALSIAERGALSGDDVVASGVVGMSRAEG